jgi:hypothetical protein
LTGNASYEILRAIDNQTSSIKKPTIIIWFILIFMAASFFIPIPYYQKEDFDCGPDAIHCTRKGWHRELPFTPSGCFTIAPAEIISAIASEATPFR